MPLTTLPTCCSEVTFSEAVTQEGYLFLVKENCPHLWRCWDARLSGAVGWLYVGQTNCLVCGDVHSSEVAYNYRTESLSLLRGGVLNNPGLL